MVKRFRQNKAVWLSYGTYLLQQGQSDAAAALLQRALKSLPSKESEYGLASMWECGCVSAGFKRHYLFVSPPPPSQVWT